MSNLRPVGYEPTALPLSYGPANEAYSRLLAGVKKGGDTLGPVYSGISRERTSPGIFILDFANQRKQVRAPVPGGGTAPGGARG